MRASGMQVERFRLDPRTSLQRAGELLSQMREGMALIFSFDSLHAPYGTADK